MLAIRVCSNPALSVVPQRAATSPRISGACGVFSIPARPITLKVPSGSSPALAAGAKRPCRAAWESVDYRPMIEVMDSPRSTKERSEEMGFHMPIPDGYSLRRGRDCRARRVNAEPMFVGSVEAILEKHAS